MDFFAYFCTVIKLGRHIEFLLLSNDCVIVPDLGGFVAHQVCARYDEEEATFLPPLRTLGFNSQLKLNDSLLVQSYIEAYDISYPEALRCIADEVRELKQHLDNEGHYHLNNIGRLYINNNGNLSFEPCEAGILTPSLYGLSTFEISPLTEEKDDVIQPKTSKNEDIVNKALKNIVVDDKSAFLPSDNDDEEEERTIKIKVSWLRNAAITAAAIVLLFIMVTPLSNSSRNGLSISNISGELFTSMMPKDTSKGNLNITSEKDSSKISRPQDTITPKSQDDSISIAKDLKPQTSQDHYCIILASRITRNNAKRFIEELNNAGISDAYTYIHHDVVRVAYGKFATEDQAKDSLHKLRDNRYFEQAWVYKK